MIRDILLLLPTLPPQKKSYNKMETACMLHLGVGACEDGGRVTAKSLRMGLACNHSDAY